MCLGAEPSQFSWTGEAPKRKAPSNREPVPVSSNTNADVETGDLYMETASSDGDAQATAESTPEAIDSTIPVDPEVDMVQSLLERIAMLEQQVSSYEEKIAQLEKENALPLERQFSLNKIKDDNAAIMFYTGFPNYETNELLSLCRTKTSKTTILERRKAPEGKSALSRKRQKQTWSFKETFIP